MPSPRPLLALLLGLAAAPALAEDEGGIGVVEGRTCAPAGAYVFLPVDLDGDGVEDGRFEAWTREDGSFRIEGVPDGAHLVYVDEGDDEPRRLVAIVRGTGIAWAPEHCLDEGRRRWDVRDAGCGARVGHDSRPVALADAGS